MPDVLYLIWALLPLALFWLTVKSALKTALKSGTREYPKSYFKELLFSTVAFIVSIGIDRLFLAPESVLVSFVEGFGIDHRLLRWLIYPAIITAAAMLQQVFIDRRIKEDDAERNALRMRYAPK
jgi:hypothetical protein